LCRVSPHGPRRGRSNRARSREGSGRLSYPRPAAGPTKKMEIIRLVEQTDLSVRATLRQLGVPRSTFYGWYQRYQAEGFDGLHDQKPAAPARWNAIPKAIQDEVLDLALERTDLSPRELACRYTDEEHDFVSESSVYRILKRADPITSPAYVLMSASDSFQHPTTRVHEM
jgi:putative transposase